MFMLADNLQEKPLHTFALIVIQHPIFSTDIFVVEIQTNNKISAFSSMSVYW